MAHLSGAIHCTGKVRAKFGDCRDTDFQYVALRIGDERYDQVPILAEPENADAFRLAAAAINGDLADELQAFRNALANPPAFREEADFTAWLDGLIAGVDDTLRRSGTEAPKPAKVTA